MSSGALDYGSAEISEIREIIKNRESSYGRIKVTTAKVKSTGEWKHFLSRYLILPREDSIEYGRKFEYDEFLLQEETLSMQQFVSILNTIQNSGTLAISNPQQVSVDGKMQRWPSPYHNHQPSKEMGFNLDWPSDLYAFMPKNTQLQLPGGPFASVSQPLFDTPQGALKFFFGFETGYFSYAGASLFVIPEYTARILEIRLGPNRLTLKVETGDGTVASDLLAKIYSESQKGINQAEVSFSGKEAQIQIDDQPNVYLVYLFSKKTSEVLDYRRFGIGWGGLSQDILIETSPENIEQIIRAGESKQVEFKQVIPKNWDEFVETAVSMSNGEGGTILLGVDDNGQIVGIEDPKISDSIYDALRNLCEPMIEPKIVFQVVQGKAVGVIQILQGSSKPYLIKRRGVFVRYGATDRLATQEEIISLVERRLDRSGGVLSR